VEARGERRNKKQMTCAEKIKTYRSAAGLSQEALADAAGYPVQTIEAFEEGLDPKVIDLMRIASVLKKRGLSVGSFDLFEDCPRETARAIREGEKQK